MIKDKQINKEDLKKDIAEIKIIIEIMKKQIEELSNKLQLKESYASGYTKEDLRELYEMRNNR